ncbi:hypothetical protein IEQ34_017342 [Dendrobium chrysotoxum]|uniref:Uncharacterized protein n=1 Tax=Dendrobium chrysotoxum TaxID=161865 RepID=A0AAV7GCA9_DENCH|nr:hypothetical protein IEQ34_017342 [Dendrobium chrysotoxum]
MYPSRPEIVVWSIVKTRVLVELDITKKLFDRVWLGPENFGNNQHVVMEDFPPFYAQCKCIGHLKGDCRPIPASILVIVNANANVSYDGNATGVLKISNNVATLMYVLSITAVVVNEDNCFLTVNDEDVGTGVISHTDKGVNEVLGANTCMVNLIASTITSPSSNVGDGVDVVVNSDVNSVPLEPGVSEAISPMGVLVSGMHVVSGDVGFGLNANWDAGEEIDMQGVDSREIYDLNVIQITEEGYFKKVVVWIIRVASFQVDVLMPAASFTRLVLLVFFLLAIPFA